MSAIACGAHPRWPCQRPAGMALHILCYRWACPASMALMWGCGLLCVRCNTRAQHCRDLATLTACASRRLPFALPPVMHAPVIKRWAAQVGFVPESCVRVEAVGFATASVAPGAPAGAQTENSCWGVAGRLVRVSAGDAAAPPTAPPTRWAAAPSPCIRGPRGGPPAPWAAPLMAPPAPWAARPTLVRAEQVWAMAATEADRADPATFLAMRERCARAGRFWAAPPDGMHLPS